MEKTTSPDAPASPGRCLLIRYAEASPSGHGAQRRSWQIEQRLKSEGFECESWLVPTRDHRTWLGSLVSHGPANLGRSRRLGFTVRGMCEIAVQSPHFARLDARRYTRIVIEATNCAAAAVWAHRYGAFTVGFPHNVESFVDPLVGMPASPRRLSRRLIDEIAALRLMHEVHTISAEDAWFFAQFGIKATVFPYRSIAAARPAGGGSEGRRHRVLVLGSATNPPTAHGLAQVLARAPHLESMVYTVVGEGTERFRDNLARDDVEIHGRVPDARLAELYSEVRYALCYQEYGSGLLTRIDDLLAAGIPVWANRHAARGYAHRPELHVFNEWAELAEANSCE